MRSIRLSPDHYAATWPTDQIYTPADLTELGCQMARLPEGAAKEDKLLEILRCFHGYLTKYMSMILRGHVSYEREARGGMNRDTRALLKILLPKTQKENKATLSAVCRTLHLAFQQMGPDEVFDVLMLCLLKSIRRYDPFFHEKVKEVCGLLHDPSLSAKKKVTASECNAQVPYDTARYLRYLSKRGFLLAHKPEGATEPRYERTESWPPPVSFFEGGPIGLSYFATQWFRYHLLEFIDDRMSEVESKQGFCQLRTLSEHRFERGFQESVVDQGLPTIDGNLTNPWTGTAYAADLQMIHLPVDIGQMNLTWVHEPKAGLFADLPKSDRLLLYYVFARDMDMESIALTMGLPIKEAKRRYEEVLMVLQKKVGTYPEEEDLPDEELTAA